MRFLPPALALLRDALSLYWVLVRIVLPVMVLTRVAIELGVVELLAPLFSPLMALLGLPPELGIAWATGVLTGVWGGAVALFALVPADQLTTAQVTVFSTLILFAHALPIEQRIVQKAGPGLVVTSLSRLLGGFLCGLILHLIFQATGWLQDPVVPHWVPAGSETGWGAFALETAEALGWMFVILLALVILMRLMEKIGVMRWLTKALSPVLRLTGIGPDAAPLTMVGLLLGLSYGGGLIIREARKGHLGARDVFLAAMFMGLCHSVIEDTLIVVALGADLTSVLVGRVVFSILAVAVIAKCLALVPDRRFFRYLFNAA
ncbi:nucleoside recognition protein [Stappia taiwanensis]|uniref:Nucleoside recognition protein n=1 Tax=Stappia taiwanensis TaxID=992267 RepID=A0A838XLZ5_9HYPH|nr:nucleoside recognition domain-containing protein [Stappia taiwanensis]MBA4611142.1 nucleoside recognition protein [Stappia taiwanensis]